MNPEKKRYEVEIEDGPLLTCVYAYDAKQAATDAVQKWEWDRVEFSIAACNDSARVTVRHLDTVTMDNPGTVTTFEVNGEAIPFYTAKEIK